MIKNEEKEKRHPVKSLIVAGLGVLSTVYLLNPGSGIIELIPDVVPVIGNLDEAAAAALLVACLAYFGLDITKIFKPGAKADEKTVSGKVVND